jgi:hypothetical protein
VIGGAPAILDGSQDQATSAGNEKQARASLQLMIQEGISPSLAAKVVAQMTGCPRRQVYHWAIEKETNVHGESG